MLGWCALLFQIFIFSCARYLLKRSAHPIVLLCLLWTIVLGATQLFASDYYFSAQAFISIGIFEICGILGAIVYRFRVPSLGKRHHVLVRRLPLFRLIVWSSLIFGGLAVMATLKAGGFGVSSLFSVSALLEVSRSFSVARYEDQFQMPALARIAQIFVFHASVVAGFQYGLDKSTFRRMEYFLPVIPSVMIAVVLTTRAAVLFNMTLWASAMIAARIAQYGLRQKLIDTRNAIITVLMVALIALMFIVLQFLRGGITDIGRLGEVALHLRKWPFGSLAGYSIWFDNFKFSSSISYGYYTFVGVFDQLGIKSRKTGLYEDYVDLGGGDYGNIYTSFRGFIEDFGFLGAMLTMLLAGLLSAYALDAAAKRSAIGCVALIGVLSFFVWTPIVSFYSYSAHLAALLMFAFYLRLVCSRRRSY